MCCLFTARLWSRQPAHGQIPQLHDAVVSSRDNPSAVGREDDLAYSLRVALVGLDARLAADVPYLQIRIYGAGCEEFAIWVPLRNAQLGPKQPQMVVHLEKLGTKLRC